jgi:hypothetical protein
MKKRKITLPDGRYLIFYSFEPTGPPLDERPRDVVTVSPRESEAETAGRVTGPKAEKT